MTWTPEERARITEPMSLLKRHLRASWQTPVPVWVPYLGWSHEAGGLLGYWQAPLRDGSLGYAMRRCDDCLQAAVASYLQVPSPQVPDLRIDEQLRQGKDPEEVARLCMQRMIDWAARQGLRIAIHHGLPVGEKRWIGIVPQSGEFNGGFNSHTLLMSRRDVLWDPNAVEPEQSLFGPDDVQIGITFIERSN